ncbi:MAG: thiolase family protein [Candidatus Dormiibacterota bacterium]|jgi:acetyl-CoA acyltransferase|nr:thiolase family protein [Candidatus Dormibacteraeota bacterium]
MSDAVIIDAVRTPVGKKNGALSRVRPDDMLALALRELVDRVKLDPAEVEDVVAGCVSQVGEQSMNMAREAALIAGFPVDVPGTTVERFCGSGQQAVNFAAQAVKAGAMDVVIGGGVESMSRIPMGSDLSGPDPLGDSVGPISPKLSDLYEIIPQGLSANRVALKYGIDREQMDRFSLESHQKAIAAIDDGRFKNEVVPVEVQDNGNSHLVDTDEGPRRETSYEKIASLPPAFEPEGMITAGNSSQISDGASAVLVMSEEKAKQLGLKPRARIIATAAVGTDPTLMLEGPIPATAKVLKKAGLELKDIDLFEVNEAFAAVVLAWLKETGADPEKVNYNGGAIALGHPLGCSGAKLITTTLNELERQDARYGLVTMCIGHGMGTGTIIERLN